MQVNRKISSKEFRDLMNNSEDITAIKANQLVKEFESFKRLAEERAKKIAKEDELRRQSSVIKYDSRWVE